MFIPTIYDDLATFPQQRYVHLFANTKPKSCFYSLAWFHNFTRHVLAPDEKLRVYGVEIDDSSRLPVAALLMRHKTSGGEVWQPRQLSSLSNYYSPLFGPIINTIYPDPSEALHELVAIICTDSLRWEMIDLQPLDADSQVFRELIHFLRAAGLVVQTYFCFGNWYLPIEGRSYEEYLQSLPSNVKNTLHRKSKKLAKTDQAHFEMVTNSSNIDQAIKAYEQIYHASWKTPEPFPQFVPGLIRLCAEAGWLRMGLVYIGGEPAAAQIWIVAEGTASIYKLAYDERFTAFSPGTLLTSRLMEYVINVDKVLEVDYLTGDDPYKRDWMSHRRERWGIRAFNPRTLRGALAAVRHVGGRMLKTMLHKHPNGQ